MFGFAPESISWFNIALHCTELQNNGEHKTYKKLSAHGVEGPGDSEVQCTLMEAAFEVISGFCPLLG